MATSESWDAPVLTSSRAAATRSLPWTWRLCCSPSHQVIKVNIWTCCLTFNYFYCVQYYVMMKYHHRLKAINRNERTRKYVFNMHDKPWINEFIDIELTTNAVFYFFPLRSCSYNSLSLLISWRRVLFWSSSNEFLFSRFWTYCLFLLRFSCAFNRFFSFLKMKTLWSRKKHKVKFWPYGLPVDERWRAWFFTFHIWKQLNFNSEGKKWI